AHRGPMGAVVTRDAEGQASVLVGPAVHPELGALHGQPSAGRTSRLVQPGRDQRSGEHQARVVAHAAAQDVDEVALVVPGAGDAQAVGRPLLGGVGPEIPSTGAAQTAGAATGRVAAWGWRR